MNDYSSSYYSYDNILARALARVPNNIDIREGSVIYDALAPACAELAQVYLELQDVMTQTYGKTASGIYQDYRYAEAGLTRKSAVAAQRLGIFEDASNDPFAVPVGSRFSTPNGSSSVNFTVTRQYTDSSGNVVAGRYVLMAETAGTIGNRYAGAIIPIDYISGLSSAVIADVLVTGQEAEDDDSFRSRWLEVLNQQPFGGNIEDYRQTILDIDGVGGVQIYPVWNGGGTVKCSIITTSWAPATSNLINAVQTMIDPASVSGQGIGTAPMGHQVTISTATSLTVNVSATILLAGGYTLGQVQPLIQSAIADYFTTVQKAWGTPINQLLNSYNANIFIAQVSAAILSVKGVSNVTNLSLNEAPTDIICAETAILQQLPVLGAITLVAA